jgi:hypothetical protein
VIIILNLEKKHLTEFSKHGGIGLEVRKNYFKYGKNEGGVAYHARTSEGEKR